MKKTFFTLAAFMLAFSMGTLKAQNTQKEPVVITSAINADITHLMIQNHADVSVVDDSTNYIVVRSTKDLDSNAIADSFKGTILVSHDTLTVIGGDDENTYEVHLKNPNVRINTNYVTKVFVNGRDDVMREQLESELSQVDLSKLDIAKIVDSVLFYYDTIRNIVGERKVKKHYSNRDRRDMDFFWGCNVIDNSYLSNSDTDPLSSTLGYPVNEPANTFSSFQLGYNYALVMTRHFQLKMGVNYESDVYKFNSKDYDASGVLSHDSKRTKIVARYASLPITFSYRSNDRSSAFRANVGVVPGICFSGFSKNVVGDKTKLNSEQINPFKCDVRFDISISSIAFFVQLPTMPVFMCDGMEKVYPIKVGFKL